ncbi:MAG TPA: F0F1 ATP synthase subunit B [Candidatus Saccharimonadales bacterium]|nr:F0F1 ATP synthase subunit B [Candidatus Saccharimonadales bacterium]
MSVVTPIVSVAAAGESGGILGALGIDWKLLVVQAASFLILVWLLGKFVYPPLIKAIETRRKTIEEGLSHAKKADEALGKAEAHAAEFLAKARAEADDIVSRSHQEAKNMIAEAEASAGKRAERIVADAQTQLQSDVQKARQALRDETIKLVAQATEEIIGEKLDAKKDESLILKALQKEQA